MNFNEVFQKSRNWFKSLKRVKTKGDSEKCFFFVDIFLCSVFLWPLWNTLFVSNYLEYILFLHHWSIMSVQSAMNYFFLRVDLRKGFFNILKLIHNSQRLLISTWVKAYLTQNWLFGTIFEENQSKHSLPTANFVVKPHLKNK